MKRQGRLWRAMGVGALLWAPALSADERAGPSVEQVVVIASRVAGGAAGDFESASAGQAFDDELQDRQLLRPGELLEVVPGLVVTQHSGDGKANQYFLRGFNLDHGTDFATSIDGLPVNMPTHAHGQGYTDLNILIPELVESLEYRKGPYYADQGDFSAAGAADLRYRRRLDHGFAHVWAGDDGYRRGVAAFSTGLAAGELLLGLQAGYEDGPWVLPEGYRKVGGLLKYSHGDDWTGYSIEGMGYDGRWRATDQIPLRAVANGSLSRFASVDPTDGGLSHRYSLSVDGWTGLGGGLLRANIYAIDYFLDLFSNFTYFEDTVHGDQFEQYDRRHVYGGSLKWQQPLALLGASGTLNAGLQVRDDQIAPVGLYDTTDRVRWKTVSESRVAETSCAAYVSWSAQPVPWLRTEVGARIDSFRFDVDASRAINSGVAQSTIASPKATLVVGPWIETEAFLNAGRGFHSNDGRGTTITVDPNDVSPVAKVSPLVRAAGGEVGVRTTAIPGLQLAASLWTLTLDSELTLDNDASRIVPSGATRRHGVELQARVRPADGVFIDADLAWTHARFSEFQPAGQYLPNALEQVASAGLKFDRGIGWFGGARVRYFGAAPITQDDAVRSRPSLQVSADVGYRFSNALSATLDAYNLLNRADYDVEYYYASRLRGEASLVNGIHIHPTEPCSVRASLNYRF